MNRCTLSPLLVVVCASLAGNAAALSLPENPAAEFPSAQNGLLPVPANRIVGLWQFTVTIAPCAGGPTSSFVGYHLFSAGGTLTDTNRAPVVTRGPGLGTWKYLGQDRYKIRFQFNRYAEGAFDGVQDVRVDARLGAAGSRLNYVIRATTLNPDGSVRGEACGTSVGERIGVDF